MSEEVTNTDLVNGQTIRTVGDKEYKLKYLLGTGGMSEVWLVEDADCLESSMGKGLTCLRALKIFKGVDENNYEHEVNVRKDKVCDNAVIIYAWDKIETPRCLADRVFIEMEYLEGKSFKEHLENDWKDGLRFNRVMKLIEPVVQYLECVHEGNIFHHDIKPSNLFLTNENKVKVLDFGISGKSSSYNNAGTPGYIPPQGITGERRDVYALAVVIYNLLIGQASFSSTSPGSRLSLLLSKGLPGAVCKVFQGVFENPADIPENAKELVKALRHAQLKHRFFWFATIGALSALLMDLVGYGWKQEKFPLPPVQNIHGWSIDGDWKRIQSLQKQTAETLGHSVVYRDTLKNRSPGPEMVIIPAGKFLMGSPEDERGSGGDERQHAISIAKPFAMGKYEVTVREYLKCVTAGACGEPQWREPNSKYHYQMGTSGYYKQLGPALTDPDHPVVGISWKDALAYTKWLSEETGKSYGLPTEAQWEYAAKGGTATPFYTGGCISTSQANYDGNHGYGNCGDQTKTGKWPKQTAKVGGYPPNPFGLFDMAGNVWEWTGSLWGKEYQGQEQQTADKNAEGKRVLRGGSWFSHPVFLRAAFRRGNVAPDYRGFDIGFRVVSYTP